MGMTTNPHYYDGTFFGMQSCLNCNINFDRSVICGGEEACMNAVQIVNFGTPSSRNTGGIVCSGVRGCYGAGKIESTDPDSVISCDGPESCAQVNRIESGNQLRCLGAKACKDSSINAGTLILCSSTESCADTRTQYDNAGLIGSDVWCTSENSCAGMQLAFGNGGIHCFGTDSCSNTVLYKEKVYLKGYDSGRYASIYPRELYVHGYRAAANAEIDSGSRSEMSVYLYGYKAAERGKVICRAGATCYLTCKYMGCMNTMLNCENGANCIVTPSGCRKNKAYSKNTACPIWYSVPSTADSVVEEVVEADINGSLMYSVGNHWNNNYYLYVGVLVVMLAIGVLAKTFSKSKSSSSYLPL